MNEFCFALKKLNLKILWGIGISWRHNSVSALNMALSWIFVFFCTYYNCKDCKKFFLENSNLNEDLEKVSKSNEDNMKKNLRNKKVHQNSGHKIALLWNIFLEYDWTILPNCIFLLPLEFSTNVRREKLMENMHKNFLQFFIMFYFLIHLYF